MSNIEPVMFIRVSDAPASSTHIPDAASVREVPLKALDGEPVDAVYFPSQRSLDQTHDRLRREGIECLEADIPPAERFLMERFIRGSFAARGTARKENGFSLLTDPKLHEAYYRPDLSVLSLDIETSPDIGEIYSISGEADAQLVYRKRLRRPLSAYRKNIPPHVRAARQLDKPGSDIRYYMTVSGPQPVEKRDAPLDYDHYIDRQIKPVADSILPFIGLSFDRIVGGQSDLFG